MSQHISVTRMFPRQSKGRNLKQVRTCLLCYREYNDDYFKTNQRDSIESPDFEHNHNTFTLFCKILDLDPTAYTAPWDFSTEAMPFCASCSSLAVRLANLYDEFAVIQQEIILNTEMIKGTMTQSQDRSARRISEDRRVDLFRNHVFKLMGRVSPKGVTGQRNYAREDDDMEQCESPPETEDTNSSTEIRVQLHSIDDSSLYLKYHDSRTDPNSVNNSIENICKIEKSESVMKGNRTHSNVSQEQAIDVRKKAVYMRRDIEVYEIEDSSHFENNNSKKLKNKNLNHPVSTEYGKVVSSQLQIQRSYNQHFRPEVGAYHNKVFQPHYLHHHRTTLPSPPIDTLHMKEVRTPYERRFLNFEVERTSPLSGTGNESLRTTPPDSPPIPGMHNCHVCGKQYSKPYQLKAHLRLHTGEKPYKCSVCAKTFRLAGNLRVHIRIHTGETPYECQFCGKRCTQKSQLNTHVLIHHKKAERAKLGVS